MAKSALPHFPQRRRPADDHIGSQRTNNLIFRSPVSPTLGAAFWPRLLFYRVAHARTHNLIF
jgi:hypothetical protein